MPIRLLSANLLHDRADASAFGQILDETAPDVVAVQELAPAAAAQIAARFDHHLLAPRDGSSGMGLALRWPGEIRVVELGGIPALAARLGEWPALAETVEVVSVHLANPTDWPQWRMVGLRRRQADALRSLTDGTPRVVVAGDCNATPAWPLYRRIRRFLDDGVAAAARTAGERPRATWGPIPDGPKLLRIDHVFVRGIIVTEVRRVDIPGSDHAGVLAVLQPE